MQDTQAIWPNIYMLIGMLIGAIGGGIYGYMKAQPLNITSFVGSLIGLATLLGWCVFLALIYGMRPL